MQPIYEFFGASYPSDFWFAAGILGLIFFTMVLPVIVMGIIGAIEYFDIDLSKISMFKVALIITCCFICYNAVKARIAYERSCEQRIEQIRHAYDVVK